MLITFKVYRDFTAMCWMCFLAKHFIPEWGGGVVRAQGTVCVVTVPSESSWWGPMSHVLLVAGQASLEGKKPLRGQHCSASCPSQTHLPPNTVTHLLSLQFLEALPGLMDAFQGLSLSAILQLGSHVPSSTVLSPDCGHRICLSFITSRGPSLSTRQPVPGPPAAPPALLE